MIGALWCRLPEVPVIVTTLVPSVAPPLALNVMVLPVCVGFFEKAAVTPFGRPEAERLTLPVNPPLDAIATAVDAFPPCLTVRALGDTARVKLGAVTINVTEPPAVV